MPFEVLALFLNLKRLFEKLKMSSHIYHNKKNYVSKAIPILSCFVILFMDERNVISHNHRITMVSATGQSLAVVSTVCTCP